MDINLAGITVEEWLKEILFRLAVIAIAAALFRLFRKPLLNLARKILQAAPDRLKSIIGQRVDQAYPSWRLKVGMPRGSTTLEWRIRQVRQSWRSAFFILGGVYLDLMVRNVKVRTLENQEHSDLDRVRYYPGGSACHVGNYLYTKFHHKSYLYSRLGEQTVLSKELRKLLGREPWIRGRSYQSDPDKQSGVSIHLAQADGSYRTTFTHKGALDGLDWHPVLRKLEKKTGRGGVLHISGYFRTGLHNELCDSLNRLSPNLIVCVDHGRFVPEDHVNQARTLIQAFEQDLVDVYVSTFPELRQLMTIANVTTDPSAGMTDSLRTFAASGKLPRVTIVRGGVSAEKASAHIILDRHLLRPVTVRSGMPRNYDQPGKNNAFNAALIHHLTKGNPEAPLIDVVRNSVEGALSYWLETTRRPPVITRSQHGQAG
jgi:hypothetical protein